MDVSGRRAALLGYEGRGLEAWVYPLKVLDDFSLAFASRAIRWNRRPATRHPHPVRPEATIVTYAHAAFTVRQILFAPIDTPGLVMLLDVDSALPMRVSAGASDRGCRPHVARGADDGQPGWDRGTRPTRVTEETGRFAAAIGVPGARDESADAVPGGAA